MENRRKMGMDTEGRVENDIQAGEPGLNQLINRKKKKKSI